MKNFTIGIEEEFQLVDPQTGQLCSSIEAILANESVRQETTVKCEYFQSMIEVVSRVCPDITTARQELFAARSNLLALAQKEGLTIISAGTHPDARWHLQQRTERERYQRLEEELQDVARSWLTFGFHVHIGVGNRELAVTLMNQARTWLPHLLALAANSPFWEGRETGLKSYRLALGGGAPRVGIPQVFASFQEFEQYEKSLILTGCISDGRDFWWDIRPHPTYNTIEFRICDMPATLQDSVALVALCQALVAKLFWLHKKRQDMPVLSRDLLEENRWQSMRYGLDATIVDFIRLRPLSMRAALEDLFSFVDDVLDDLGSRQEIEYLRQLVHNPGGTGADQQLAIYRQTQSIQRVIEHLIALSTPDLLSASPSHYGTRLPRQ